MHFGVRQDWILILKRGICITDFIREDGLVAVLLE